MLEKGFRRILLATTVCLFSVLVVANWYSAIVVSTAVERQYHVGISASQRTAVEQEIRRITNISNDAFREESKWLKSFKVVAQRLQHMVTMQSEINAQLQETVKEQQLQILQLQEDQVQFQQRLRGAIAKRRVPPTAATPNNQPTNSQQPANGQQLANTKQITAMTTVPTDIGIYITTGKRPNDHVYLDKSIDALRVAQVNPQAIMVYNTMEKGTFPSLEVDMVNTFRAIQYPLNVVDRAGEPGAPYPPPAPVVDLQLIESDQGKLAAGDNDTRKQWRTKEAYDFLMASKAALEQFPDATWLVYLQDDAVYKKTRNRFSDAMATLFHAYPREQIFHLNQYGNVAVAFKRQLLEDFVEYGLVRYDIIPVDWLLDSFLKSQQVKSPPRSLDKARLFSHIGKQSSFHENPTRKQV